MTEQDQNKLTQREDKFVHYYFESNNGEQSAIKAGFSPRSAHVTASRLLNKAKVRKKLQELNDEAVRKPSIMSGQEVMEMYTKIANGEIKDQFGLDASLSDRLKALDALARRTVDIENRESGRADNKIEISLNWER